LKTTSTLSPALTAFRGASLRLSIDGSPKEPLPLRVLRRTGRVRAALRPPDQRLIVGTVRGQHLAPESGAGSRVLERLREPGPALHNTAN